MKTFKQVFDSIKGFFNRLAVVSIILFCVTILWAPHYVPAAQGFGERMGNWWIIWRGTIFLVTTIIIIVAIGLNFIYIVDDEKVNNVKVAAKKTSIVHEPGPHLIVPVITTLLERSMVPTWVKFDVPGIEVQRMWPFRMMSKVSWQLIPENSWHLVDKIAYDSISETIKTLAEGAAIRSYRGVDLDNFWGNETAQKVREKNFLDELSKTAEEWFMMNCGEAKIVQLFLGETEYEAKEYQQYRLDQEAANIKAKQALIEAENAKAVQELKAKALLFSMQMEADGKKYGGMRDAEVQKQMGQVLKEYNELIFQEAMKNLPDCLSLGGSGVDMATIAAGMWSAYRKATSTTPPIVPPFTGPSGSLPKP